MPLRTRGGTTLRGAAVSTCTRAWAVTLDA